MPFSRIKAGFLAGVAMLVLVPSAHAQYSTTYTIYSEDTGSVLTAYSIYGTIGGTNAGSASFTAGPTGTTDSLSFSGTIDGYLISVSGSFNPDATSGPGLLAFTTSLTIPNIADPQANYFTIITGAGDYTTPLGSLNYTNTQTSSGLNSTNTASFSGTLAADSINIFTSDTVGSGYGSTTSQSAAAGTLYDLTQTGFILTDGTSPVSQTMTSLVTTVPEPNSILLGLLGLPCMGLVVYFASRRSSRLTAEVA